ncbi:MAG TPA: hypothetical protein DCE55_17470 [Planctomycetaceae bacterium]|nr:hypothetical protein [Planctomycetaceae bacterium]
MTVTDSASPIEIPRPARRPPGWSAAFDAILEGGGDWLNPILVKESRQALKSRQFLICFGLVLGFGWGWSLLGIAILSPGVHYIPGGAMMLSGYVTILAVPVLVIVPFTAFRSLASEVEDGTFELLSITALSARQIVTGKLGSAAIQLLIYFSALSPCVAFTYLLRGVDIVTITAVLVYGCLASLLAASIGLLCATLTRSRIWQGFLSIGLVLALFFCGLWLVGGAIFVITDEALPYQEPGFLLVNVCAGAFYLSVLVMLVLATASQITFASENRSTRIRVVMLVQQLVWTGSMVTAALMAPYQYWLMPAFIGAGVYWGVMGAFLVGEEAQLSPRARRRLPQSLLGRVVFTWFNPGSGTGYIFCIANFLALAVVMLLVDQILRFTAVLPAGSSTGSWFVLLLLAYLVFYLGVGRLLVMTLRRFVRVTQLAAVFLQLGIAFVGSLGSWVFQTWVIDISTYQVGWQLLNWGWSLTEVADHGITSEAALTLLVMGGLALVIFGVNLWLAVPEASAVRMLAPERVLEDDSRQLPQQELMTPASSPWQDMEGG